MQFVRALLLAVLVAGCDTDATSTSSTASVPSTTSPTSTSAAGVGVTTATSAVRGDAVDCGEDVSTLDPVGPPSVARQCFLDANLAGKPATLTISEIGPAGEYTALLRTNPDGTIQVTPEGGGPVSTCAGLATDERRVFRLAGCDPPLPGS